MTEKDRLDLFLKMAESSWKEYDTRRSYEWKINLALWAALGAIIGLSLKELSVDFSNYSTLILICMGSLSLVYIFWLRGLWKRNEHDQKKRHEFLQIVRSELGFKFTDRSLEERPGASGKWIFNHWSLGTQAFVTIFLSLAVWWVLVTTPHLTRIEGVQRSSSSDNSFMSSEETPIDSSAQVK